MKAIARIEYTIEVRGSAVRRAKEVRVEKVDLEIARLENRNGYNFVISYCNEVAS